MKREFENIYHQGDEFTEAVKFKSEEQLIEEYGGDWKYEVYLENKNNKIRGGYHIPSAFYNALGTVRLLTSIQIYHIKNTFTFDIINKNDLGEDVSGYGMYPASIVDYIVTKPSELSAFAKKNKSLVEFIKTIQDER